MNTEITENVRGYVFYDAGCPLCRRWVARLYKVLRRRGMRVTPLQTPWVIERLGLQPGAPLVEMKVLTPQGMILGGVDAMVYLARFVWWGWPLRVIAQLPGMKVLLRRAYRWFAQRRHCSKGGCTT